MKIAMLLNIPIGRQPGKLPLKFYARSLFI